MKQAEAFCHFIDMLNTRVAQIAQFFCLPMVLIVSIEVISRYFFDRPTIWAWDLNIQILALISVLGAGYTLLQDGHVRVDIIITRFSPRVKLIVELVMSLLFFFGVGSLLWWFREEVWASVARRELQETLFAAPLYPLKVIMFAGLCLLLLQGLAKFVRNFMVLIRPQVAAKAISGVGSEPGGNA